MHCVASISLISTTAAAPPGRRKAALRWFPCRPPCAESNWLVSRSCYRLRHLVMFLPRCLETSRCMCGGDFDALSWVSCWVPLEACLVCPYGETDVMTAFFCGHLIQSNSASSFFSCRMVPRSASRANSLPSPSRGGLRGSRRSHKKGTGLRISNTAQLFLRTCWNFVEVTSCASILQLGMAASA